jgi:hypothetical protein
VSDVGATVPHFGAAQRTVEPTRTSPTILGATVTSGVAWITETVAGGPVTPSTVAVIVTWLLNRPA